MKIEPILSSCEATDALRSAPCGDLILRPVLAVSGRVPLLAGVEGREILDLAHVVPSIGLVAVCRDLPGRVVILGYAKDSSAGTVGPAVSAPDAEGWIVIGTGKAQIRMHPDGRIRLKAEDVVLDSAGRFGLRGAFIDLN